MRKIVALIFANAAGLYGVNFWHRHAIRITNSFYLSCASVTGLWRTSDQHVGV